MIRGFRVPLAVPFRGLTERTGILIEGPAGWGELSAFPDYDGERAARWAAAARAHAERGFPAPVRARVPVNVTVPAVGPEEAFAIVSRSGCDTAKVKVGDAGDEARLEAVRAALGPSGKLRIDANGAWPLDEAERRLRSYARFGLDYAEQPVATVEELAALRRRVDVRLAADESIRIGDPERVRALEAADVAVLKVHPLGGVGAALRLAERIGLPCVVSSALETSVGLAAGLALAACLPELYGACGLGTAALLAADVVAQPLLPQDGWLVPRPVVPDEAALARCETEPDARLVALLGAAA